MFDDQTENEEEGADKNKLINILLEKKNKNIDITN